MKKYVKTFEYFTNNELTYKIIHDFGNIHTFAFNNNNEQVGQLSIIDHTDLYDEDDMEKEFNIYTAYVNPEYRKHNVYINMIKYYLQNNTDGVKYLFSYKEPEFDDDTRSNDADMFWEVVYKNQRKYGVDVIRYDDNYQISLI